MFRVTTMENTRRVVLSLYPGAAMLTAGALGLLPSNPAFDALGASWHLWGTREPIGQCPEAPVSAAR